MPDHDFGHDIHHVIASDTDRVCKTSTRRHTQKLDSLSNHLSRGETAAFITEGTLYGAFRADIFVVSEHRLLAIRKNGKAADAYPLTSLAHIRVDLPDAAQRVLITATFDGEPWRAHLPNLAAATLLAYSLRLHASLLRDKSLRETVTVELPTELSVLPDTSFAHLFLRRYNLDNEQVAMWLPCIARQSDILLPHELVLGMMGFLTNEDADTFAAAITTNRLLLMSDTRDLVEQIEGPLDANVTSISPSDLRNLAFRPPTTNDEAELELRTSQGLLNLVVPLPIATQEESYQEIANDLDDWAKGLPLFNPLEFPIQALQMLKEDPAPLPIHLSRPIEEFPESQPGLIDVSGPESQISEPISSVYQGDPPDDPVGLSAGVNISATQHEESNSFSDIMLEVKQRADSAIEAASRRYSADAIDRVTAQYEAACLDLDFPVTQDLLRRFAILDLLLRQAEPSLERNLDTWRREMLSHLRTYDRDSELRLEIWDAAQYQIDEAIELLFELDPDFEHDRAELTAVLDIVFEELGLHSRHQPIAAHVLTETQSADSHGESSAQLPAVIHGLSPQDLAQIYDCLAAEIADFSAFTKWQLSHLPDVMLPGELLVWLADGYLQGSFKDPGDSGSTMIAVTDRRLLLFVDPLLATNQVKAFRLTDITAVHRDGGLISGGFRFRESGGGQRKIREMKKASAEATVAKLQAAIDSALAPKPPPTQPPPSPQADTANVADQLEKLANLVERGFLTPEEFAEQKAKLLNG